MKYGTAGSSSHGLAVLILLTQAFQYIEASTAFGTLSNFDVINDENEETHGFEIELEGIHKEDVTSTFGGTYSRYGDPVLEDKMDGAGNVVGAYVRYVSKVDASSTFLQKTAVPPATGRGSTDGHSCYNGGPIGAAYDTSGCEHFGVSFAFSKQPTKTFYRWLKADPTSPGHLIASAQMVDIPAATWTQANNGVVAVAVPKPPNPACSIYGDAKWMKVTVTETEFEVELDELLSDSTVILETETEVEWELVQAEPTCDEDGGPLTPENRVELENQVAGSKKSVVRKFEFFKYTGPYDAENHEAKPLSDGQPADSEIGDYIGSQMVAVKLKVAKPLAICFSGENTVELGGGKGYIAMKDLKIGDMIRVGPDQFDRVYSFGHYDKDAKFEFLQLHFSDHQQPLEISSSHMVFLENVTNAIPAQSVKVGDTLLSVAGDDGGVSKVVSKIDAVSRRGAFAPFTHSGVVSMNGVVVSSYATLLVPSKEDGNAGLKRLAGQDRRDNGLVSMHWLAHTFQAPHRVICLLDWEFCVQETYTERGLSRWVDGPLDMCLWILDHDSDLLKAFLLLPPLMLALTFAAVESLIHHASSVLVLLFVVVVPFGVLLSPFHYLIRLRSTCGQK